MDAEAVIERVRRVATVRADDAADNGSIEVALIAEREIRAWLDASKAELVAALAEHSSFPESTIADTSRCSLNEAARDTERATTLGAAPSFASALDDAAITAGHVDALTRGSKQLSGRQRDDFFARVPSLVEAAANSTVNTFGRTVRNLVNSILTDGGESRLTRQKKATTLSTWTDREGMWNVRARFDPETALRLAKRLDDAAEALFAEAVPDHCPTDAVAKHGFLRAHALARLMTAGAGAPSSGRPELIGVIDADADGTVGPAIEWSIPIELPARVIAELAADATINGVVVRNGVVLYAPGELNLGRTSRLANRDQRRALRGLYRTCAIPGCDVHYDRCKLHHLIWWRNGGRTDLANLLPLCAHHHHNVHDDGWDVALGPRRELTLRLPDGSIHNTGPPSRRAA